MTEVGLREVAAHARVSIGTVSNVLNKPHVVAPTTAHRVRAAIAELGYVPNVAGRLLRSGRSHVLGMAVVNITNPFFSELVLGAEETARDAGYSIIVGNSYDSADKESDYLDLFDRHRLDGVLLAPVRGSRVDLERYRRRNVPIVLVDRDDESSAVASVSLDDVTGGELAASHLLARRPRHLAFLGGPLGVTQLAERLEGCRSVAESAGIRFTVMETDNLNPRIGRELGDRIASLPAAERPDALFAANDLLALGVLQSLLRHGIRVPDEVAMVGYDDIEFAEVAIVPLSSVRQPSADMGRQAAALLLEQLAGAAPRRVRFQPELIVRDSSR